MATVFASPYEPEVTDVLARLAVTFAEPLNDVPVSPVPSVRVPVVFAEIVPEPPKLMEVPLIVILLFVRPELGMVAFICDGAIEIVVFAAFVSCPCALTVKVPTVLALPYVAAVTAVLAIDTVPVVVIGPPVKPVPVLTCVTVPVPPPLTPPATFSMDHLRVRHQA